MSISISPSPRQADFVPESFEDLYRHYYLFVVRLVRRFGIANQNAEDVAQAILTKFFEKDALEDFDADYASRWKDNNSAALFRTFLSGFVRSYVRHYVERQTLLRHREGFSADQPVASHRPNELRETTWLDMHDSGYEDEHPYLEQFYTVQPIREALRKLPRPEPFDRCDMSAFFEAVLRETLLNEKIDTKKLAVEFGVSTTSIQNWMRRLRVVVHNALEE